MEVRLDDDNHFGLKLHESLHPAYIINLNSRSLFISELINPVASLIVLLELQSADHSNSFLMQALNYANTFCELSYIHKIKALL